MEPNHVHKAVVTRVHDGDSFFCLVFLDFFVRAEIEVRLHNYSAPELYQPGGGEAFATLRNYLMDQKITINSVFSEAKTEIQQEGTRSFTRWVCDVEKNLENVSDYMRTHAPSGGL